jgi:hypothetical protein
MKRELLSKWIRPLAVGFIAWNALGAYACVQQIALRAGGASLTDPFEQALYSHLPWTYDCLFVGAETSGLVGAVLLLLGRSAARAWLAASLIFIILQFGYLFATTDLLAHEGPRATFFPLFVTIMGAIQLWAAACAHGSPLGLVRSYSPKGS